MIGIEEWHDLAGDLWPRSENNKGWHCYFLCFFFFCEIFCVSFSRGKTVHGHGHLATLVAGNSLRNDPKATPNWHSIATQSISIAIELNLVFIAIELNFYCNWIEFWKFWFLFLGFTTVKLWIKIWNFDTICIIQKHIEWCQNRFDTLRRSLVNSKH